MNFSLTIKFFFSIICFFILCSCSSTNIYNNLKFDTYEAPKINIFEKQNINLSSINNFKVNYKNKIALKELRSKNLYFKNIIIKDNKLFFLTKDIELVEFNLNTGEIISTNKIENISSDEQIIVSFNYISNSFILGFKSGHIIRINMDGEIIWKFESNKVLNTSLIIFEDQIISLYVDEIKSIFIEDGTLQWSEIYEDLPVFQAKGGKLVSFFNLLYFILPNNKVGSIDLNLGTANNSKFNEISFISSINNTNDKIHIHNNFLVYLDEGKYLYTFDILKDEFILFKKNIDSAKSSVFFNNSLILKEGNYIYSINIYNGNLFWLFDDLKITKKSRIINVRNTDTNIEIFLSNGDIVVVNEKKLIEVKNLNINNIEYISFENKNIIIGTKNGKTVIF